MSCTAWLRGGCMDDLCRGGGRCMENGAELAERCGSCGKWYVPELDEDCACEWEEGYELEVS